MTYIMPLQKAAAGIAHQNVRISSSLLYSPIIKGLACEKKKRFFDKKKMKWRNENNGRSSALCRPNDEGAFFHCGGITVAGGVTPLEEILSSHMTAWYETVWRHGIEIR